MGENQLAFASARETFDMEPAPPLVVWANTFLMVQIGEIEWAKKMMALAPPMSEIPGTQETRAWASFNRATGNDQANLDLLDQLKRQRAMGRYVSPYAIGIVHLELGQYEGAITWFENAVSVRAPAILWTMPTRIRKHPALRHHPRALALLERMGTSL
jgi:tetratricopeptide (TPR) repeat protein